MAHIDAALQHRCQPSSDYKMNIVRSPEGVHCSWVSLKIEATGAGLHEAGDGLCHAWDRSSARF